MNAPLLEVRDLNVWFSTAGGSRVHAVRGVNFTIDSAERAGLVGESGCGKSTTILALLGLLPPTAQYSGSVLLRGTDILADGEASVRSARWTEIAMVFQGAMNAFNPVRRIASQLVEVLQVRGGMARQAMCSKGDTRRSWWRETVTSSSCAATLCSIRSVLAWSGRPRSTAGAATEPRRDSVQE